MANYRRPTPKVDPPDVCTVIDELCITGNDPDTCTAVYMGYPLLLSPAEMRLLLALVTGTDEMSAPDPSDANVRMCVKRINDKTRDLGGRDLILRGKGSAYRINPRM